MKQTYVRGAKAQKLSLHCACRTIQEVAAVGRRQAYAGKFMIF